jgi:hypothetical protein
MSTIINRTQKIRDGVVTVSFRVVQKGLDDDALIQKFGDIKIKVSGTFADPHDRRFPPFHHGAGPDVPLFTRGGFEGHFADPALSLDALQHRARLWGDAVQLQIQNRLELLRGGSDDTTLSVDIAL